MRQTALARHLPDCVGETHGAGGGGVSFCVPLGVVATSGAEETAGRSRLTSNRRFASGRRPGWLRPREVIPWRISANRSNHRPSRRPVARRPTGESWTDRRAARHRHPQPLTAFRARGRRLPKCHWPTDPSYPQRLRECLSVPTLSMATPNQAPRSHGRKNVIRIAS